MSRRLLAAWALLLVVTAVAWRENLVLGFTDVDALADAAWAGRPWSEQLFVPLTGGVGGANANFWRPVVMLHYKLLRTLFDMNPVGWQAWDLGLHLACVGLLGALVRGWRGLLAAAIFALHPLQVEIVPAVARNIDSLLGVFTLLALLAAQRGRFVATVLACGMALGCKETAVVVLPVVWLWWRGHRADKAWPLAGALVLLIAAYIGARAQVLAGVGGYGSSLLDPEGFFKPFAAGPVASLFPGYSLTLEGWVSADGARLALGIGLAAVLAGVVVKRGRDPMDWLGLALWLLPLVLYGMTSTYSRRLLYVPLIGLALMLSGWLHQRRFRVALALVLGSMLPHTALIHGHDWGLNDRVTLSLTQDVESQLREAPEGARIWVMDRCVRFTVDTARVRAWGKGSLNNCVARYSIQAWADDVVGRDQSFALLNLSYPTRPLDEPQVRVEGDAIVVTRVIEGRRFYQASREAGWETERQGDSLRLRYLGERQDDHLLIASGGAPVFLAVP